MTTLAFDVYGTLIDTAGVTGALEKLLGGGVRGVRGGKGTGKDAATAATEFSNHWRAKQLEYTFRYGLMNHYRDFRVCTRQALDYCCASLQADVSPRQREHLMAQYLNLPAFDDVAAGLARLSDAGAKMYAFSNGLPDDLEQLLNHAGIRARFDGVVSVDEVSTFKPNPAVYHHFLSRAGAGANPQDCWLISGNPFDICGARAVGMQAVWMRRNPAVVFDAWDFAPTHEAASLVELAVLFGNHDSGGDDSAAPAQ